MKKITEIIEKTFVKNCGKMHKTCERIVKIIVEKKQKKILTFPTMIFLETILPFLTTVRNFAIMSSGSPPFRFDRMMPII